MKEGWSYKKLGEVCELYQPKTISTKDMVPDGKYNVYGANGVIGKYNQYNHKNSEILMTCRGATCGNINISSPKSWINGNAMVIHIKDEALLDRAFLVYTLIFIDKKNIITGAAQPQITRQTLSPLGIAFPPLSEQRSIVSRLDSAFSHIDALKANAEKQLNEARKLFQAELTECMKPKEGWEEKRIKEVGEVIGGTTPSTTNPLFWGGDICWISPAELHGEHYLYDSVKKITKEAVEAKSLKELPIGTVILSSRAPIGKIAINKVPMYCNQGFKCVVCKSELYNEYLYWWFYGKKEYLNSLGTGATFLEISKTVVENIIIPIPPLDTQQAIVSHLDSLSSTIRKLEELQQKTLAECDALKQAMLREVFE